MNLKVSKLNCGKLISNFLRVHRKYRVPLREFKWHESEGLTCCEVTEAFRPPAHSGERSTDLELPLSGTRYKVIGHKWLILQSFLSTLVGRKERRWYITGINLKTNNHILNIFLSAGIEQHRREFSQNPLLELE